MKDVVHAGVSAAFMPSAGTVTMAPHCSKCAYTLEHMACDSHASGGTRRMTCNKCKWGKNLRDMKVESRCNIQGKRQLFLRRLRQPRGQTL